MQVRTVGGSERTCGRSPREGSSIALSGMQGPGKELTEVARAMREPIKGFGLLSDFAIRKARSALGRERVTRVHPALSREAVVLEEYAGDLARNVDKVLRKHGEEVHGGRLLDVIHVPQPRRTDRWPSRSM